jgi:hypothetical protein
VSVISVSIDRSDMSGSPAPLVISDDGAVYRFTQDGLGYVVQSVRTTFMPDSIDVDGSEPLAFAREATSLALEFYVIGTSTADLAAKVADMEDALYRLSYPVTRTVDGVAKTYAGAPCALIPKRGSLDSGVQAAYFDTFSVVIPFPNPNGA